MMGVNEVDLNSDRFLRVVKQLKYPGNVTRGEMTEEQKRELEKLKKLDKEIKEHEEAHYRAGGAFAYAPQYTYKRGPDGNNYAIQGTTRIRVEEGNTPEETIRNAQMIKRAAFAPRSPSDEDRRVAFKAIQMENKARQEQLKKKSEKLKEFKKEIEERRQFKEDGEIKLEKPIDNMGSSKVLGMKVDVEIIDEPYEVKKITDIVKAKEQYLKSMNNGIAFSNFNALG